MADLDKNLLKKSEQNASDVAFPPIRSMARTENSAGQSKVCTTVTSHFYIGSAKIF